MGLKRPLNIVFSNFRGSDFGRGANDWRGTKPHHGGEEASGHQEKEDEDHGQE